MEKECKQINALRFKLENTDEIRVINSFYELDLRDYHDLMARLRTFTTNFVNMHKKPHLMEITKDEDCSVLEGSQKSLEAEK